MSSPIVFCKVSIPHFDFNHHGADDEQGSKAAAKKAEAESKVLDYFSKLYAKLEEFGIKHTHKLRDNWRDTSYYFSFSEFEIFITQEQFFAMLELGYDLKLVARHEVKDQPVDLSNIVEKANLIVKKLEESLAAIPERHFNDRCEVHVPGLGLLSINRTMLLEDSCTDRLQDAIADGWRIIAACPQPDQRRPDYILGKYDPEYHHSTSSADRG